MKPQRGKTPRKVASVKTAATKLTDPVEVYCRVRPLDNNSIPSCVTVLSTNKVQLSSADSVHANRNGGPIKETENTFQYVFDECTSQKSLFDHTALPLVEDLLNGKNSLLFMYGVTSSGKTHTMMGMPQDQGLLPRSLDVLFNSISQQQALKYVFKPDKMNGFEPQSEASAMMERQRLDILPRLNNKNADEDRTPAVKMARIRDPSTLTPVEEDNNYSVFVSYIEIYNNFVYDLLEGTVYDTITGYKAPMSKILREDLNHNMYVSNVMEVEVKTTEEAYEVLHRGQKRRKVAHTALNTESSRSHSVFNIRLIQAPLDPLGEEIVQDKDRIVVSQLSMVDLAGSERTKRTGNCGDRLREAGSINQSLMVLRTCIEALRDNQQNDLNRMVPYRDSRLTHLFKNYFDGEGKVRMVVCINPRADEYDETIQVMRFSEMTQEVQVARPQQVCFDKGLAPGRRRLNQQYKDAVSKAVDAGIDPAMVPQMIAYTWPLFPIINNRDTYDASSLQQMADYLKERQLRRATLLQDFDKKEERFRARLLEVDREGIWLRGRVSELESALRVSETENGRLQRRLKGVEKAYDLLQRTATGYETQRRDLEKEIDERDYKIHVAKTQKDQLQMDYHAKLMLTEQNYNRHIQTTRKFMKEKTAAELRAKQQKLDLVKNIIESSEDASVTPRPPPRETPTPRTRGRPVLPARIQPARSEPNLAAGAPGSTPRAPPRYRAVTSAYAQRTVPRVTTRARSPPPVKPKPVMNSKYHRRSKSADVWLEHIPVGTVPTGTVLQPKLKKKKSVARLTEDDTKRASHYILTHQDVDSEGNISTKLIKGNMVPTGAGGTSVIFNDVENLTQTSPGDRKRKSPTLKPEDFDGEWTDVETRCKIGIEGHGISKRPKTSHV